MRLLLLREWLSERLLLYHTTSFNRVRSRPLLLHRLSIALVKLNFLHGDHLILFHWNSPPIIHLAWQRGTSVLELLLRNHLRARCALCFANHSRVC